VKKSRLSSRQLTALEIGATSKFYAPVGTHEAATAYSLFVRGFFRTYYSEGTCYSGRVNAYEITGAGRAALQASRTGGDEQEDKP
jgi:hypothetical protein